MWHLWVSYIGDRIMISVISTIKKRLFVYLVRNNRLQAPREVLEARSTLVHLDSLTVVLNFCQHALRWPFERMFHWLTRLSLKKTSNRLAFEKRKKREILEDGTRQHWNDRRHKRGVSVRVSRLPIQRWTADRWCRPTVRSTFVRIAAKSPHNVRQMPRRLERFISFRMESL